ncbi:YciI family protein [Streptomyces sp. ODS28]|uniref:YciI family protein n=1 Tax=Streptomyces sp. ODS28 TaxID=3136688 RepID=UPI0031EB4E7D
MPYFVLEYRYPEDVVERRAPYREEHLGLIREAHARGELLLAGALAEPVDRGLLIWNTEERGTVERFAENDPYVLNGVVEEWTVRPWTVVTP